MRYVVTAVAGLLAAPPIALAVLAGTAQASAGPGPTDAGCVCTKEYAPVVGSDGKTYSNACMAKCAGVQVVPAPPRPIWHPHPHPGGSFHFLVTVTPIIGRPPLPPKGIPELCPPKLPPGAVC